METLIKALDKLRPYALSLTKSIHDAEDLIQDAAVNIFSAKVNVGNESEVGAYCNTILRNLFIDKLRKKKRRPHTFYVYEGGDSEWLNDEVWSRNTVKPSVFDRLEFKEQMDRLKLIPRNQQNALMMYAYGYDCKEIGKATGVCTNTVLGTIRYGRMKMKGEMPLFHAPKKEKVVIEKPSATPRAIRIIKDIPARISNDLKGAHTLVLYMKECKVAQSTFHRIFTGIHKDNFRNIYRRVIMEKALSELTNGTTLKDVTAMLPFSDIPAFKRSFKDFYGYIPK